MPARATRVARLASGQKKFYSVLPLYVGARKQGPSLADYLAMGGYAAYVWSAFGIALLLLLGLFVQSSQAARRRELELEQLRGADPAAAGQGGPADAARS